MDKKLYYILGTIFIISSGFIYVVERGFAYYTWVGQLTAHLQSYSSSPQSPNLITNIYIPLFLIIGIVFYVSAYKKRDNS
jgi:hypothetical protein